MRPKDRDRRKIEEEGINLTHHQKRLRYLKARRNMRQLQINLVRIRSVARVFAIVFIAWALVKLAGLPQWYLSSSIFSHYPNSALEIEGNHIVSDAQIIRQLSTVKLPDKTDLSSKTAIIENFPPESFSD